MTYALNIILVKVSENAVTAYGLYYKIQQFVLFAAFGLRDAITPVVSFNHGMRSKKRVKEGIKYGMIYTIIIMTAGLLIIEIFAGINVALQGVFQALDSGFESLIISILRQFLLVVPVAYRFALIAVKNIEYIWLVWSTFPIAEVVSSIVAILFMKKINAKKINTLEV